MFEGTNLHNKLSNFDFFFFKLKTVEFDWDLVNY